MVNNDLRARAAMLVNSINKLENEQQANIKSKNQLENSINILIDTIKLNADELDMAGNAIAILQRVSDESVKDSYTFMADNINATLERIFEKSTRKIRLVESLRAGQYPQLDIELTVENGKKRSLRTGSGHGLSQIISILSILCLIVITHSRKTLWMDEITSGLSNHSRKVLDQILWSFTDIGFQFVISEWGFIPKGSKVYNFVSEGGVSRIDAEYIEESGVYLHGWTPLSEKVGAQKKAEIVQSNNTDNESENNNDNDTDNEETEDYAEAETVMVLPGVRIMQI